MIITCASCLTKFNLDDTKLSPKGTKVRCSRCQQIFLVMPPPVTKEEILEDFESFAKYHEALIEPDQKKGDVPLPSKTEPLEKISEDEEEISFLYKEPPTEKVEPVIPEKPAEEERTQIKPFKPKRSVQGERKRPSPFFSLLVILLLLIFGVFYLWTELESTNKFSSYIEYPIKKIAYLWDQISGTEKESLIVGDLNGYEGKAGEVSLFIIEGKINNQSQLTKKHIKIRAILFDRNKAKIAEKEILCGRLMSQEELKDLPETFFAGPMIIKPQAEKEMITPPGNISPFMVIFKEDPSNPTKEFKVEIVEAPNL
jgi:predicted Zn finger-like uncharacterized protein